MNKIPLILIGGGGHCRSCIDVVEQDGRFTIEGILDNKEKSGGEIDGYTILGGDELIAELAAMKFKFLITVGQIKSSSVRFKIFEHLQRSGAALATVISSRAYVSKKAVVGAGTIVLHGSVINAGVNIGANCIINTKSLAEHDVTIGDHVHISTGARVNGGCVIGSHSFIGSGAIIANGVRIIENVVVGAGAVVIKDITESGVYAGNPSKKIS